MKTPDEIKKGLECCLGDTHAYHCDECPYADDESEVDDGCGDNGIRLLEDALTLIQQLEAQNNVMYHTIIGVMHFVDKWLGDAGYDPESDRDGSIAINRAAKAREIALKAIEEAEKRQPF